MAKRKSKKSQGNQPMMASPTSDRKIRVNTGVEEVENGFVVNISSEGGPSGEYVSKRYITPDHASAIRISSEGMARMSSKSKGGKKKNGKRKSISTKKV